MKSFNKNMVALALIAAGFIQSASAQQVTDLTQQAAPAAAPVVPPPQVAQTVDVPAPKSSVDFSGSFKLHPFGYDREEAYFSLWPQAGLSTFFNAFGDKKMNFSISWDMRFRKFFTDDQHPEDTMDFLNELDISFDSDVASKLNLALPFHFESAISNAPDAAVLADYNEIWVQMTPTATYKMLPSTSLALFYNFIYDLYPDEHLSAGDVDAPSSDPGEIGGFYDTFADNQSLGNLGTFSLSADPFVTGQTRDFFIYWHEVGAKVKHNFNAGTSGSFEYKVGRFISNNDNVENFENHFDLRLSQKLITKTVIGLNYRLRIFDYIYAVGDDGAARRDTRNRIYLTVDQQINKWLGLEAYYRYQKTISNKASKELDPGERYQFWAGAVVSF